MKLTRIAIRNIWRNKRRTVLTMSAIAIAALVIVFMFSVIEGMKYDQVNTVIRFTTGHIRIRNAEYERNVLLNPLQYNIRDYKHVLQILRGVGQVEMLSPRIRFGARFGVQRDKYGVYEKEFDAFGLGVDFSTEKKFEDLDVYLTPGSSLPGKLEILLTVGLAQDLGAKIGDRFDLFTAQTMGGVGFNSKNVRVSGIVQLPVANLNKNLFLMPIDDVSTLLRMDTQEQSPALEILIILKNPNDIQARARVIADSLNKAGIQSMVETSDKPVPRDYNGLLVTPWTEASNWYTWLQMADISYNFIALFFFIMGTTVIINTTMMIIYERMREIGTISAMGMTGGQIVRLFFLEAFFTSVIASGIGVLLGMAIVGAIGRIDLTQTFEGLDFNFANIITLRLNLKSTLFTFVYSVGVASLISFIPSRRAARIDPVQALHSV
ncbi:MAG: ABC transporter permease [Spirochaetia bacterium]